MTTLLLTLPVRMYFVPTPYKGGGGVADPAMISKTVHSTKLKIVRTLGPRG